MVGPALPFESTSEWPNLPWSPRYHDRCFHPIVVGSSAGRNAIHGAEASERVSVLSCRTQPSPSPSPSRSTGTAPAAPIAFFVAPAVQPDHHWRSAVVAG